MPADLDDPVFFSALLEGCKSAVNEIVKGRSDLASQRLAVKQLLDRLGYRAAFDKFGTLEDLRSDVRLNLILNFNTQIVQGYGQWLWQYNADLSDAFPAQELFRVGRRKFTRDWNRIWDEARKGLPDTSALESASGRLVALIDDPIWAQISDFGLPWPPFKFGSGMGIADIDYDEACELGLVQDAPKTELHVPMKEAIIELLTNDMAGPARPPPQIIPDFERLMILTLGNIDPASLPPSWN